MKIPLEERIAAFIRTGEMLRDLAGVMKNGESGIRLPAGFNRAMKDFLQTAREAEKQNPWFDGGHIGRAIEAIAVMLASDTLHRWLGGYPRSEDHPEKPLTVLIVMAGNIPLVGFHDLLCVLISGHRALVKTASADSLLPQALAALITEADPRLGRNIAFSGARARNFDAVIATGSNNSARYFDYYFGQLPHIIRKNRNSMAVLTGNESVSELRLLGDDVFSYYGLGCRNVSQLWVPAGFSLEDLASAWGEFREIAGNPKYLHNLLFQRAISQVNRDVHTDLGFSILREDSGLASPLAVVHYQLSNHPADAFRFAAQHLEDLQCLVCSGLPGEFREDTGLAAMLTGFGQTQQPAPWEYADRVDTLQFLTGIC